VASARKLLVSLWQVLTKHVADCHADSIHVAHTLLRWGKHAKSGARSRPQFVRQSLDTLGLGQEVETLDDGGQHVALPPSANTA
jgi:hypothetical protein